VGAAAGCGLLPPACRLRPVELVLGLPQLAAMWALAARPRSLGTPANPTPDSTRTSLHQRASPCWPNIPCPHCVSQRVACRPSGDFSSFHLASVPASWAAPWAALQRKPTLPHRVPILCLLPIRYRARVLFARTAVTCGFCFCHDLEFPISPGNLPRPKPTLTIVVLGRVLTWETVCSKTPANA
jgi:hypothetical protein